MEEAAGSLPPLFFGTFQLRGEEASRATQQAMELGYRAIDTASIYRNEEDIAMGLAASGVRREDVFITSKLAPNEQGYSKAMSALTSSLQRLNTSYLDLYLIHWPGAAKTPLESPANKRLRLESWQALEDALKLGMIRRAGVSNFCVRHLQELLACSELVPCVNQVELHPACFQEELLRFCEAHKVQVQAYSPLGSPAGVQSLLSNADVLRASKEEGVSAAQVLIRWAMQTCGSAVARSSNEQRLAENLETTQVFEHDESTDTQGNRLVTKYCWDPSGVA
ncbi:hypothetical protein GUITHDRAFT_158351 [Guillardia theta CCMP2712]|uniref:NADP-dependent oxidoreductase domain-containing protein n=1 Tax=Guillardia theta (strain CCMP2712) TaxID=905079 RepID=L1IWJ4_GUITC|nr:hypothetical protein GUITHDRAFT_158351 [Guillardia theta CCMP2712]EKX40244.1 hypothetical protein GUITHDRAFT_158351 [Guillardia theta CCMP2712]|eukprot:XP_005827224.1 hypothetical protein GUITHDRAFT_158351 [Guillardia theta CCMP2712]